MEKIKTDNDLVGTKFPGVLGAFYGAMVFGIPMLLSLIFFPKLYVFAPLAVLIPIGSSKLYRFFKGYKEKRYAFMAVSIESLVMIFLTLITGQTIRLSRMDAWKEAAVTYDMKAIDLAWISVLSWENFRNLLPVIAICFLIGILGVVLVNDSFGKYANLDKEAVQKANEEIIEKQKEEKKLEKEKNLQHKIKPKSLQSFVGKPEEALNFTTSPSVMQKHSMQMVGSFFMLLGLGFSIFLIIKVIKGTNAFKLLSLPFLFFLIYQGCKFFLYGQKSIKIEEETLLYKSYFGKSRKFSFSEIESAEEDKNIIVLRQKDGKLLATFALSWENSRKLKKALEDRNLL